MFEKILDGHANVLGDLAKQDGRNIPTLMHWHGRTAPVGITKLLVRTALPDLDKTKPQQYRNNLCWLEYGNSPHRYPTATF